MRISTGGLALLVFFWPALFAAPPVKAQSIDLDTMTCKTFLERSKEDIAYTIAWLDGYYKGDDDPAVIDFEQLNENKGKLGSYCKEHPEMTLANAAEELFGK